MFLPGVVCILLVSLWMADQAAGPPTEWNGIAYLTQTVRWITRYPAVLGLGNLYDCLAYNASSLLYAAMLESGPWAGRATHISNGLLVLMVLFWVLLSGGRAIRSGSGAKAPYIFDMVLLTPIIAIAVSVAVSSFTTDIPGALVTFIAASLLYRFLTNDGAERPSSYDAGVIIGLSSLAICLKASMIAIGPTFILVVFVFLFRVGVPKLAIARLAKWSLAASALLIVPWMLHGILLSGYPLFPSTFLGLNRDWKVPADYAVAVHWWIITAARHNSGGWLSWTWIPHWFKIETRWLYTYRANQWGWGKLGVLAPSALTMAAILVGMIPPIRGARPRVEGWFLFVACAVAAMIWFGTAPASRFGFSFLWSLAAAAVAQAISPYGRQARWIVPPIAAMAIAPILFPFPSSNVVKSLAERVFVPPGPDHGLYPFPEVELKRFVTESGLVLFVPANDERCYDAPQPCTPDPTPNLILRMQPGGRPKFVTQGSWQPPIDWPNIPFHAEYVKFGPQRAQP
ncbi:MAG TPA: hypothetical protein VH639_02925 [Bryobacteraceae bacterium]